MNDEIVVENLGEIGDMIDLLQTIKVAKAEHEREIKKLGSQYDIVEHSIIKRMTDLGLEKAAHNGITVSPEQSVYPHVEDWAEFGDFILENKYLHLLERRPTVTGYRELLALGRAVPGVVPYVKTKLSVRKS